MFQPKKTIPKLIVGALALSGCGDSGGARNNQLQACLNELGPGAGALCRQLYADNGYGDGGYGYGGYGYGDSGYGDNGGVALPDNDPNPTNDPFLPGGDSFYGGGSYGY